MKTLPPASGGPSMSRYQKLENERLYWVSRYIEWQSQGWLPEAKIALENIRVIRDEMARMNNPRVLPPPTVRLPRPKGVR